MPHPLVVQLRFARGELLRAIDGVSDVDSMRRLLPMNSIGWNVGHLAWQEQRYWLRRGQGRVLRPDVQAQYAYGAPGTTPPLSETLAAWREITAAADPWLDSLGTADLLAPHAGHDSSGSPVSFTFGTLMLRTTYHYWYHVGESMAIRQQLGHRDLPEFVGNIDDEAPYRAP